KRLLLASLLLPFLPGASYAQFLVKDINAANTNASSSPTSLTSVLAGVFVYFSANDGVNGSELWKTDGTTAGTVLGKDINPGSASSPPANFAFFGGKTYFSATDATNGSELWVSDGTAAGTTLVMDINPGATGSTPAFLTVVGSNLFFAATDATNGREL